MIINYNIYEFYPKSQDSLPSLKFIKLYFYLQIEFFILSLIAPFLGTHRYTTKSGKKDYRYKNNEIVFNHTEMERKIAFKMLLVPAIFISIFIIYIIISVYSKKN